MEKWTKAKNELQDLVDDISSIMFSKAKDEFLAFDNLRDKINRIVATCLTIERLSPYEFQCEIWDEVKDEVKESLILLKTYLKTLKQKDTKN